MGCCHDALIGLSQVVEPAWRDSLLPQRRDDFLHPSLNWNVHCSKSCLSQSYNSTPFLKLVVPSMLFRSSESKPPKSHGAIGGSLDVVGNDDLFPQACGSLIQSAQFSWVMSQAYSPPQKSTRRSKFSSTYSSQIHQDNYCCKEGSKVRFRFTEAPFSICDGLAIELAQWHPTSSWWPIPELSVLKSSE